MTSDPLQGLKQPVARGWAQKDKNRKRGHDGQRRELLHNTTSKSNVLK